MTYRDVPEDVEDEKRSEMLAIINRIMKCLMDLIDVIFGCKPPEEKP